MLMKFVVLNYTQKNHPHNIGEYNIIGHMFKNWLGTMVHQSILSYSPLLNVYYRYLMVMLFLKKVFQKIEN